jgi:hypothetical protein
MPQYSTYFRPSFTSFGGGGACIFGKSAWAGQGKGVQSFLQQHILVLIFMCPSWRRYQRKDSKYGKFMERSKDGSNLKVWQLFGDGKSSIYQFFFDMNRATHICKDMEMGAEVANKGVWIDPTNLDKRDEKEGKDVAILITLARAIIIWMMGTLVMGILSSATFTPELRAAFL